MQFEDIINKKFDSWLQPVFSKLIGYYDGELYKISKTDDYPQFVAADQSFKPLLLIISPKFYTTKVKSYPIDDRKELQKLLALNESDSKEISIIQKIEDHKSTVGFWSISNKVPTTLFTVPESFLFGEQLENSELLTVLDKKNKKNFLMKLNDVIYSAKSTVMISNKETFLLSIGGVCKTNYELSFKQKSNAILNALLSSFSSKLFKFRRKSKPTHNKTLLLNILVPIFTMAFVYLSISSLYLYTKNNILTNQVYQQQDELRELISLKTRFDENVSVFNQFSLFQNERIPVTTLLNVISPIFEIAKVNNITTQQNVVKVRGESERATNILEIIVGSKEVTNAKFDSPVRKVKGKERFNISFELNNDSKVNNDG